MDLIHFIVFACIVYIAIVLGRMSMKNDMRRRFASIEEGIELPNVTAVIDYILKLRDLVAKLEHDYHAANNSLNIANATVEKLERDYKVLLAQLKEKRKECEAQETFISQQGDSNKELVARINKCADKFDEWMQKSWEFVSAINNNTSEHSDKLKEYFYFMNGINTKSIYVTGLVNKTYLLSIGQVEVLKNGSLKYSEGSRSLGNYTSKENRGWLNELKPMAEKSLINPRESKPIATIIDYYDYKVLSKKYREVSQSSDNVISELVKMRVYMKEIKNEFPNILYNKKS